MLYSLLKVNQRFVGTCRLHLQGWISQARRFILQSCGWKRNVAPQVVASALLAVCSCCFLFLAYSSAFKMEGICSFDTSMEFQRIHGFRVPGGSRCFVVSTPSRRALGSTQPHIQWVPGVKRPGREDDHSPPASAEVKKMWIYTSTPPYAFMA
jgi:hypothetical protein